jgi:tRNA pseudouridine55 synthase
LLLLNKPRGVTSFAMVSRLRKMTGIRRIGHTGTLDPFAEGLLPMAVGRATAAVQYMACDEKLYQLELEFGWTTDTFDSTGTVTSVCPIDGPARERLLASDFADLRRAVAGLAGERLQTPPMYSAVKVGGKPLYAYARRGETVERKARPIRILEAGVLDIRLAERLTARLLLRVSKGTYIRSLADDLGRILGWGAVATGLVRLESGPFRLCDAWDPERLQAVRDACASEEAFLSRLVDEQILLPVSRAFAGYPVLDLPAETARRLLNGQRVPWPAEPSLAGAPPDKGLPFGFHRPDGLLAVHSQGRLVAVARLDNGAAPVLCAERVLIDLADFRQA